MPLHCTSCGASNSGDAKFCAHCGAQILHPYSPPQEPEAQAASPHADDAQAETQQVSQAGQVYPQPQESREPPRQEYSQQPSGRYYAQPPKPEGEPVSGCALYGGGCLVLLVPVLGPIIGLIFGIIWAANRRRGGVGFLVYSAIVMLIGMFFLPIVIAVSVPIFLKSKETEVRQFTEDVLVSIRAAEANYYIKNGKYGDFEALASAGFLDSRFAGGAFFDRGVSITLSVAEDEQSYTAYAILPLGGTMTLDETGNISTEGMADFGEAFTGILKSDEILEGDFADASAKLSANLALIQIRLAESLYYATENAYADLPTLAEKDYLDKKYGSNSITDLEGVKGMTLEFQTDGKTYRATITLPGGGQVWVDESGEIQGEGAYDYGDTAPEEEPCEKSP
ncbi:MAG: zinc-ribbon domain-containing protein, partial [bacterium]